MTTSGFVWCEDRQQRTHLAVCVRCKRGCFDVAIKTSYVLQLTVNGDVLCIGDPHHTPALCEMFWEHADKGETVGITIVRNQEYVKGDHENGTTEND